MNSSFAYLPQNERKKILIGTNTFGWPSLASGVSQTIAQQSAKGGFVAGADGNAGSIMGTWYFLHKIKLVDLHPIFKELDLVANPQLKLKLRLNAGSVNISVASGRVMTLSSVTSTSGRTVPFMVTSATASNAMASVLHATNATTLQVAYGPVLNSLTTLATAGGYYPYTTCQLQIPFYDLANPSAIVQRPIKTSRYLDCYAQYFNQRAGLGVLTTQHNAPFNFQLSGTWKNIKYVAVIPFAETSSGHWATANGVEQFASPFDSAPWTCQPGASIRNFQVQVGNTNVFPRQHSYDYESFLDEFSKINAINGDQTVELSNGLIDIQRWSTVQRIMIADCSRFSNPDVPQSINVSGTNASSQGVNLLVLVVFERQLEVDRITGEVQRLS